MVAADPYVGLFCNRRAEKPSVAIFADQLRESRRVAVFLTKRMCFLVLGLEMKNVDSKTDVGKVGVGFDMLSERTVVIEEDVIRLDRLDAKGALQKFLEAISFASTLQRAWTYRYTGDAFCAKHGISPKYHAAWCHCKLLVVGP